MQKELFLNAIQFLGIKCFVFNNFINLKKIFCSHTGVQYPNNNIQNNLFIFFLNYLYNILV